MRPRARGRNGAIYQEILASADAIYFGRALCYAEPERFADRTPRCDEAIARYRKAVNALYIYGTDAAWTTGERLTKALLNSVYAYRPPRGVTPEPADPAYIRAFAQFQQIMCRELSVSTGTRCKVPTLFGR